MKLKSLLILFLLPTLLNAQKVISIKLNGGINPASAEYIHKAIEKAESEKAECLLIHLNTPGGLLNSTRDIVGNMFSSTVPIIVYVSPAGAHAGSAGVFITMAANIAAMAPGTNIGAAHPVMMQGSPDSIMNTKMTNDAAAFIRTIAVKRNRSIEWAEDVVRNSVSVTDEEAIEKNIIDYIANDDRELLTQIDGKKIEVNGGYKILHTKNASVNNEQMGFFQKILDRLSDPNIAYMLMMIGFFGILFELFNPGAILPGIVGVIALIFAFYSMSSMPVNYAGLSLIIFAIILFLLEIKIVSHGILTVGGIVSLVLGSLFLFRASPAENFISVSLAVIIATALVTTLFFLFLIGMGIQAQRAAPVSGMQSFPGKKGEVIISLNPKGAVKVNGEIWNAEALSGNIAAGEKIIVKEIKNLILFVDKA